MRFRTTDSGKLDGEADGKRHGIHAEEVPYHITYISRAETPR